MTIVVATHNGAEQLVRLTQSMMLHGTDGHNVLVVDCGSTDPATLRVLHALKNTPNFTVTRCENGFETGAWVHAYRKWIDVEGYLFIHDSCEITGKGWVNQFTDKLMGSYAPDVIVPWVTFEPYLLGLTPPVRELTINTYGLHQEPGYGIFGSIFFATRGALRRIDEAGYMDFIPKDKAGSEATERFWALYCARLNIPVRPIHPNGFMHLHRGGQFPLLTKHFHGRGHP